MESNQSGYMEGLLESEAAEIVHTEPKHGNLSETESSNSKTLQHSSKFNNSYDPTRGINISGPISLTNGRVLSLLEYHGATFDQLDSRCIDTFYGLYGTDLILFHCKTSDGYTTFTQYEFLDPITKEVPLDYFSQNNFGSYKRFYHISSSRYTGEVFLEGMVRLATINGTTREKDYVYLIWKKRNGEYFYLSYIHYMSLTPSEKKFLVNLCPVSPVDFPDKSYSALDLE
jgi:hypothetical protein